MTKESKTIQLNTADQSGKNFIWWMEPKEDLYLAAFAVVNHINANQLYRNSQNLKYARLYQNMALLGLTPSTHNKMVGNSFTSRLALNVIKSCVDTAAAKIASNKPRPIFLTENGDYSLKRKAKYLTKYLEGLFDDAKVYAVGQRVFIDSCVFGTGALKVYIENGSIKVDRVIIDEIVVDDTESMYGTPRQLHQRKHMSREVLIDMYPEHAEKIKMAKTYLAADPSAFATFATSTSTDQVQVIESWHLPSGPNAADGRHTICIDNCTLADEEWTFDYFPFVFLKWSEKLVGFFGVGLGEELLGIQVEINRIMRDIQEAHHRMGVPRVFIESMSKINTDLIQDTIGGIINYTGQPPIFESPGIMNAEVYQWLENLIKKAYEITGISQMNAAARKEPGITSGVAIREVNDIASERFILTGMRYEDFYMAAARIMIDLSRKLYEEDNSLSIKAIDNKFIKQIKWKDVNLSEDKYCMRLFPTSLLPSTPAGKLSTTQELYEAGFISKEDAVSLLSFPDLESVTNLATSSRDNVERMIELMLVEGKYQVPEPYMDLQLALKITQQAYLSARNDGVEEDKLELLRVFMDDISNLLVPPQAPAPVGVQSAPAVPVPVSPAPAPLSPMPPVQ